MDSDLFDDILADNSEKTARSGNKFQPKAKPRGPRLMKTDSGGTTLTSSQPVQTSDVSENELKEYCETDRPAASDDHRSFGVVNASPQHLGGTKNVDSIASLGPVMDMLRSNTGEDWDSCFGKSMGENADIFIVLESLGDFLPDSTTVLGRQTRKYQPKKKMQAHQRGSKIGVPHADVVETVSCQQDIQLVSPDIDIMDQTLVLSFTPNDDLDFSSVELSHTALPQKTTEVLADQEPGNLMGNSHQEAGIRGEHLDAVPEMPLKLASRRAKIGKSQTHTASHHSHTPKEC